MTRRRFFEGGVLAAMLLFLGLGQDYFVLRPNRNAFVHVMRDLRWGMGRQEVALVLEKHNAGRLTRRSDADVIFLLGQTGLAGWWQMDMAFSDDRLSRARVWTEDGPYHPAAVPPDILGPSLQATEIESELSN